MLKKSKKPLRKEKVAAKIVMHRPNEMSKQGRRDIAQWLRNQAADLIKLGDKYDKNFTSSYIYFPNNK